jgi:crotonobetainyl-CoA:carnitine CoA-transferase CaiB-like acyl-CoA transferase
MTGGPLAGLEVLDLTTMISGGFATVLLADFGADVVSVEHPEHEDPVRSWEPKSEGTSVWWKNLGRNKRHVTLDLSAEEGQTIARDLASEADIVVENFRPGTLERWNLAPDRLRADNPGLVVVRISGFGQNGPYAERPGFGTVAEAMSTFAAVNGFPDTDPLLPPIPIADLSAGMFAALSAMYAVYERDVGASGQGQVIDVSLYEPLFRLMTGDVEAYDALDHVPEATGNVSPNAAPRNIYETADGYIGLSASTQRIFENVMDAIGREELVDDERFATNQARVEHRDQLDAIIENWTSDRHRAEVLRVMRDNDAIVGPIYDIEDVFQDDHYRDREDLVAVTDDEFGTVRTQAPVPKFSRTPGSVDRLGGDHGENTEEVYRERLGLDAEELRYLREEGII